MSTVSRIAGINTDDKHLKANNPEEFQEDEQVLEDETEGELEELESKEADTTEDTDKEEDVLPRFKGKTASEISKAYAELEALNGRLSNEVGDYRKMAKDFLFGEQKTNKDNHNAKAKPLTEEDFLERPVDAVTSLVEDKVSPVLEKLEKVDANLRMADFQRRNPDYMDLVANAGFADWVKASPYRTRLYQKADAHDFDAADELLSGFRETVKATETQEQRNDTEKKKNLRKVSTEKSSSATSGKKKIWSSAYLINLKITNPDKYNSLQADIMEAYREGRVK